jgi:hypothetical protein
VDVWNRDELYVEVWEQPMATLAKKYGISDVMLGKVCRRLSIPVPGRGFWAKKSAGQLVKRPTLTKGVNIPVVQRHITNPTGMSKGNTTDDIDTQPKDLEALRIAEMEARTITLEAASEVHKLLTATGKYLRDAHPTTDGVLEPARQNCLEIRVSGNALERALSIMGAILAILESEGFPVSVDSAHHGTCARIFGYRVQFALVEKLQVVGRREVAEHSWTRTIIDRKPTGVLELRSGDFTSGRRYRDGTKQKLENILPRCIAGLMHEARDQMIATEKRRLREIEDRQREKDRWELSERIRQEQTRVEEFEGWVSSWSRSKAMRDFIAALENCWVSQGRDLSPEAPDGQRIIWMKQQADRLDPLVESPPSILDRSGELRRW